MANPKETLPNNSELGLTFRPDLINGLVLIQGFIYTCNPWQPRVKTSGTRPKTNPKQILHGTTQLMDHVLWERSLDMVGGSHMKGKDI